MEMIKNFVGNQFAFESIQRHIGQDNPGPMILFGSSGLGKLSAAKAAASALLGVPIEKLSLNTDYYILDNENAAIKVDDVMLLLERSSISSVSGRKIYIIRNAENMNVQAQNKLLKLLEDRNKSNKLILTCNRNVLLDTVISRCNVIPFYPLAEQEMNEYLKLQGLEPEGRHLAAYLCFSCPYKWDEVKDCYDDLRETYLELLEMERTEDIFLKLHLLVEKDHKSFYEVHSKHLLSGLQLLQYVFFHIMLIKLDADLPDQVVIELKSLESRYSLQQAYEASEIIERHKCRAVQKYTKNDFFDLVRSLV